MTRFLFVITTLFAGVFLQHFFNRYLSIGGAAPDAFLLLTVAFGFVCGPVLGQVVGFLWGLVADSSGTELFGMSPFVFTVAGFVAGALRRRVASERLTGQLVVGLAATVYQALAVSFLLSTFESAGRLDGIKLLIEAVLNVLFVPWLFLGAERWLDLWGIEREHI